MANNPPNTEQVEDDGSAARLLAARGLSAVLRRSLTLDQFEQRQPLTPLATELLYGSARHYFSLAARVQPLLRSPIRQKDQDVWALLIVGAYQLMHTRVPDHAAIAATVSAARRLRQPWGRGLINGTLRSLQRQISAPPPTGDQADSTEPDDAMADLPEALQTALQKIYGAEASSLATALNARAPMALRVNVCQNSPQEYGALLKSAGIDYRAGYAPETLILTTPQPAASLPEFASGAVSVQDAGAQLAAMALAQLTPAQTQSPLRVLDACAAPGGKLFHLLEQSLAADQAIAITAVERSAPRLAHLEAEAKRLGHYDRPELALVAGDATGKQWWDGQPFDLILLDAPCSGSGTLRRHPDIKLLRDFSALDDDIALQNALLASLSELLRPGGRLLYATCSVLPAENDARVARALRQQPNVLRPLPMELPTGAATAQGWQLLPTNPDTDGFYYAAVEKLE